VRPSSLRNRVSMMRYESRRNFRELRQGEVPRTPPLGSWVHKGKRKGRGFYAPALAALFSASNCYGVASCTM
jgi:hypothetical protein